MLIIKNRLPECAFLDRHGQPRGVFNENHLRRILPSYFEYYNNRTHL